MPSRHGVPPHRTIELPKDFFFIGEVANVYASESVLTDGTVDVSSCAPSFSRCPATATGLSASDVGDAWSIGKALRKPTE